MKSAGIAALLGLILGACADSPATPSATTAAAQDQPGVAISLRASEWRTISQPDGLALGNDADGRLVFDFPSIGSINYLYTSQPPQIMSGAIEVSLSVAASGPVVFDFMTAANNTCAAPASVRPFFWAHQNGSGEFDRWWSNGIVYDLAPGSTTLTVPLAPDRWSSVFGKTGTADAAARAGFTSATAHVSSLGLTFGGGCFFGHGVFTAGGRARFALASYLVQY